VCRVYSVSDYKNCSKSMVSDRLRILTSVECRVTLRRPEMILSEAGVDIVDSPIVLSIGVLLNLVIGKDSTVNGTAAYEKLRSK
jgi:hypothetical protein